MNNTDNLKTKSNKTKTWFTVLLCHPARKQIGPTEQLAHRVTALQSAVIGKASHTLASPWYHHEITSHTLLSPCIDKSYLGIVMQWQVIPCYHRACQTEWQTQRTRLVSVIPRQRHQGVLFLHTASDVKMTTIRYTGGGGSKNSLPSRCSEVSENFKAAFYRFDIYPYSGLQTLKKI